MDAMIPVVNRQNGKWWKLLQFPVTRFLVACVAVVLWIVLMTLGGKLGGVTPRSGLGAFLGLVQAAGVPVIYTYYVWLVERRDAAELSLDGMARFLARGILFGAALFCVVVVVLKLLGAWQYTGLYPLSVMVYPCIGALISAFTEEVLFRGVLFRIVEESLGSWIGLVVSAVVFGLLHGFNPGASVVSTAAIALEAGVLLAAAYMYTRSLWFVMGLHFAWNFTEGGVFAASVSGSKPEGVIGIDFTGSELLSGGAFGPEASLPAVVICLAAGIWFIIQARRANRVVQPFWKRK